MRKTQVNLLEGSIIKSMILFAIPFLISNIFQQLYNTVDTIIVGHSLGEVSLAAIGASAPIYDLLVGLALGIGSGMGIVIGRNYGSRDENLLKRTIAATLVISVIVALLFTILSLLLLMPLLKLLNTPAEILDEAYSYVVIIILFMSVSLAYNIFSGTLRAIGNSLMPLIFLAISSVINILLDLLFIRVFHMGVQGAAIATVISQAISALLCLLYIYKECKFLIPDRKHFFTFQKDLYEDLVGQGVSMGLMGSLVSMGSVIMQYAINSMGYLFIAGHIAAKKLFFFTVMPLVALCTSLSTFVAQNKGANQGFRIRKAVRYSNIISISWAVFVAAAALFIAPYLMKLLTGSEEATVINYGSTYIRIQTAFYVVLGPLFNFRHSLQGLGKKILPLISSTIEMVGKIIFTFFIIPYTGYMGVILCEPVIWSFMFLQLLIAFYKEPYIKEHSPKKKPQSLGA